MRKKTKIITLTLLVLAAYFASIAWGVHQITSSEVFPLAKKALVKELTLQKSPDAFEPYHLRWWWSWNFKNRREGGEADFPLCTPAGHCYLIQAVTVENGVWRVIDITPQK
jgi:hypothetical protein